MMAHRGTHRAFPARRKRAANLHWTLISGRFGAQAAGTAALTLVAAAHIRETCIRMRGTLSAFIDAVQVPGREILISVGVVLVPEGTGTTVLWSPFTDGDAPWMYWSSFVLAYEEMVTDVIDVGNMTSYREVIDNKAMRIVRPDTEIQLVVENTTLGTAAPANVNFVARALSQQS